MHCARKVMDELYWVGGNDRRLALFENAYPIPQGISYNAYLLLDEKTVLLDTVDHSIGALFFENVHEVLGGRKLDYVIVNHTEPDHCGTLAELCRRYPDAQIVCNSKAAAMIGRFFGDGLSERFHIVAEGDTLCTGAHTFQFYMAPMVHWPEVMVTYDTLGKVLFSADAFGTFGALGGNLFADELDLSRDWPGEARRYYANIVGKYGTQVQSMLQKVSGLEISMLCPLHGPIWRKDISRFVEKYFQWSAYLPEETAALVVYGSIYGHTANAAEIVAGRLAERGVRNIVMYDVSKTEVSELVSEAFRCSHLVLLSATYNAGIFTNMEIFLHELKAHNFQNRTVALAENGSWAPMAGGLMRKLMADMKNMNVLEHMVTIPSAVGVEQRVQLLAMADEMASSMLPVAEAVPNDQKVEQNAFFKLGYGLYVLSAQGPKKDEACIINTVMQVTDQPKRICIAVNKQNYTHDAVLRTGMFNISVLTTSVPFSVFQHFGFHSGRDVDKFEGRDDPRSENGLRYLQANCNAYLSGKVIQTMDCGTHSVFVADVTEAKTLNEQPSVTYSYYFDHIKPKPAPQAEQKRGFVCKICGFFYEGDTLPPDYICPLCKHGAEDFEPVGF